MMIDLALEQKPADFEELLKMLIEMGCEVSRRGKAIRLKAPGWKNVARMDERLGDGYSEAEIRAVLAQKSQDGKSKEIKELLGKYGVVKLSAVKQEDYPALLQEAKVL